MNASGKIFVINLKRSPERRAHMTREMAKLGMPWEFVDAVDGHALAQPEIDRLGNGIFRPWSFLEARRLLRGEIGCVLSHLEIYRRMVHGGIENACIFEDDCVFARDFGAMLKNGSHLEHDWDILFFGHSGFRCDRARGADCAALLHELGPGRHLAKPCEPPFGTYAYAIRSSAAARLLQHAYPIRMPMDYLTSHSPALGLKLRAVTPPPAAVQETNLSGSTIYADRRTVTHLYFRRIRRIKRALGDRFPALKTINRACRRFRRFVPIALTKTGLRHDEDYLERRLFPAMAGQESQ